MPLSAFSKVPKTWNRVGGGIHCGICVCLNGQGGKLQISCGTNAIWPQMGIFGCKHCNWSPPGSDFQSLGFDQNHLDPYLDKPASRILSGSSCASHRACMHAGYHWRLWRIPNTILHHSWMRKSWCRFRVILIQGEIPSKFWRLSGGKWSDKKYHSRLQFRSVNGKRFRSWEIQPAGISMVWSRLFRKRHRTWKITWLLLGKRELMLNVLTKGTTTTSKFNTIDLDKFDNGSRRNKLR